MVQSQQKLEIIDTLIKVLKQSTEGRVVVSVQEATTKSLRQFGLDSVALLSFLVAVENEFGIQWDDDLPEETLTSLGNIANYIKKELGIDS
jgi:acyl carrier protein